MKDLLKKQAVIHMIGIGGIGMSGLAQLLVAQGYRVTGSDRGAGNSENSRIIGPLKAQGIDIFPQDGSYVDQQVPDAVIYSTAIEDDNPDLKVAAELGIETFHRSEALAATIENSDAAEIAVTGTCGKTTVTSWLGETMCNCGQAPAILSGGLLNRFSTEGTAGNYVDGEGEYFVFEADESDKSLTAYHPDYAVILNVGTDHYPKDELLELFKVFVRQVRKGVAIETGVYLALGAECFEHLDVVTFSCNECYREQSNYYLSEYRHEHGQVMITVNRGLQIQLPVPGEFNAENAMSILALLDLLQVADSESVIKGLMQFSGVWRRFDFAGTTQNKVRVYDDYAHNVEKIVSCIKTAQEICDGRLLIAFQPHGFGPLGFMKDALFDALEDALQQKDSFVLLPVFYAGGTTSFKPTSKEVVNEWQIRATKQYHHVEERGAIKQFIDDMNYDDLVLIMGARDNSLSLWAKELTQAE